MINTVTGSVRPSDLGATMAHEHVLLTSAGINRTFPELAERERTRDKAIAQLTAASEGGLGAIVDVTPMDLGRDIELLREISEASGIGIVASTGVWFDVPRIFWSMKPKEIAPLFVRGDTGRNRGYRHPRRRNQGGQPHRRRDTTGGDHPASGGHRPKGNRRADFLPLLRSRTGWRPTTGCAACGGRRRFSSVYRPLR